MFNIATTTKTLFTGSFGRNGIKKIAKLRTAFKSETTNEGLGEIEALLYKKKGQNFVHGYKSTPKPLGIPLFETDFFRRRTYTVWKLAPTKISKGLVCFNTEPGFWVISPEDDMDLNQYKFLLESLDFKKIPPADRNHVEGFGEAKVAKTKRDGLLLEDQLAIQALENFILGAFQRCGITKYEDEISHIDNDIAHARLYLQLYKESSESTVNDVFVNGGSFNRANSNSISVLRPKSELFRTVLIKEIQRLESASKRAAKEKHENKSNQFHSQSDVLSKLLTAQFSSLPKSEQIKREKQEPQATTTS